MEREREVAADVCVLLVIIFRPESRVERYRSVLFRLVRTKPKSTTSTQSCVDTDQHGRRIVLKDENSLKQKDQITLPIEEHTKADYEVPVLRDECPRRP